MPRLNRPLLILFVALFILLITSLAWSSHGNFDDTWSTDDLFGTGGVGRVLAPFKGHVDAPINGQGEAPSSSVYAGVHGGVIMTKLGNATAKAELGRATWKLLHTMTLRFPEHPTDDERNALDSFFHLASRLYPCGECATEFQLLLKKFPPQTSSRLAASQWLCVVHNQVNERLGKPEYDCAHLEENYDCGCAEEASIVVETGTIKGG